MLGCHFGPLDSLDHHVSGIDRSVSAFGGGAQPVVMISGHQHEFASSVARNLDRLTPGAMLKLSELALETK